MKRASPIERRLVLAAKLRPDDSSPNWSLLSRLPRGTDALRFATAVQTVLNRTPSFTRAYHLTDEGIALRVSSEVRPTVPVVKYQSLQQIKDSATQHGDTVFDLSRAPLFHAEIAVVDAHAYFLFAGAHVCSDGFGFYNLIKDFAEAYADPSYAGSDDSPTGEPYELADESELYRQEQSEAARYFRSVFVGVDDLHIDGWGHRDALGRIAGGITRTPVDYDLYVRAGHIADALGIRRYSVLVAAWALVVGCLAETTTVVIATPMANRRSGAGAKSTRGVRVNTLPLRCDLSAERRFTDLARDTDRQLTAMIDYEQHSFSDYSRSLFRSESMDSTQPSASFTLYPQPLAPVVGGERGTSIGVNRRFLQYPLTAAIEIDGHTATVIVERADFLPVSDVAALYTHVLQQVLKQQPVLTIGDVDWMVAPAQASIAPLREHFSQRTLIDDIREQACATPHAPAIITDVGQLTYRELDRASDVIAQWVRNDIGAPIVGVALESSAELIATIIGVFKAGAVYLPVDSGSPSRTTQIMAACGHPPVVTMAGNPHHVEAQHIVELPADMWTTSVGNQADTLKDSHLRQPRPTDTAYILFTSGTTGTPKGVQISHASAARFFDGLVRSVGVDASRWLQSHAPTFDISLIEIFAPLTRGGAVCVPRVGARRDPEYLADFIARHRVQVISQTPSAFTLLQPRLRDITTIEYVMFCGERLEAATVADFVRRRPDVAIMNCYGITETTMYHTAYRVSSHQQLDQSVIGSPFPDVSMAVIDRQLRIVPRGVAGQLVVGGDGLMQGYIGDGELTDRQIVEINGARMYLTGDRGTMAPNGNFTVIGRIDKQVKIRGHRCEPEEIQNAVLRTRLVRSAHVQVDGSGLTARLLCFVVLADGVYDVDAVCDASRELLPRHFVPDRFFVVPALPMTVNGKVDVSELANIATEADVDSENPKTATELGDNVYDTVRQVWAEVLGTDDFGRDTNFFDAGGTSAMVLQVGDKLRQRLAFDQFDVVDLFEHHTPAALARLLSDRKGEKIT